MLEKIKIKRGVKLAIAAVAVVSVIGFTETKQGVGSCKDIVIRIDNRYDNYFINDHDVLALMTANGTYAIKGVSFRELNLKEIEERVKHDPFIRNAQLFKDLKGNVIINVALRRPIARIIQDDAPDAYVAMDGTILPVSDKFSSRVMLLRGSYMKAFVKNDLTETDEGKKIFRMIGFINDKEFWRAQIAQMNVDKKLNITLYPQVTKQYIEFGQPEELEEKFNKLEIFYKQILPRKGWNSYERVNLMYEGQIVAE